LEKTAHLFRRTCFAATWPELIQALADGPQVTVDSLLSPTPQSIALDQRHDRFDEAVATGDSADALRSWWLRRMLETPFPLQEKMTLFWQGRFGIAADRVGNSLSLLRYQQALRRNALGDYRDLLKALLNEPALFVGLGAEQNRRAQPNPALARWLLQYATVGGDNHPAADVQELARSYTGWFVFKHQLRFIEREQDPGAKMLFGQEGSFTLSELVDLLVAQRATAEQLVYALYGELIADAPQPEPAFLAPLVDQFQQDPNIGALVSTMIRSNWFFAEDNLHRHVKSPVEFCIGTLRSLESIVPTVVLAEDLADMGQNLYAPPTLAGWPRAQHWITNVTLTQRQRWIRQLVDPEGPYAKHLALPDLAAQRKGDLAASAWLAALLHGHERLDAEPLPTKPAENLPQVLVQVLSVPEYQLA